MYETPGLDWTWVAAVTGTLGVVVFLSRYVFKPAQPSIDTFKRSPVGRHAGVSSIQGRRTHMEDTYQAVLDINGDESSAYYGVFDGHGGDRAARYVAQHLYAALERTGLLDKDPALAMSNGYKECDRAFLELARHFTWNDGTTSVTAFIRDGALTVAHCGDSRSLLVRGRRGIALTDDHKPDRSDEKQRIVEQGGSVTHLGVWRVQGVLAVSRSFGDRMLKRFVIPDPEVSRTVLGDDDDWLVLASDGVWDVFDNQQVADYVVSCVNAQKAARTIVHAAFSRGSFDNITCLVVDLRPYRKASVSLGAANSADFGASSRSRIGRASSSSASGAADGRMAEETPLTSGFDAR